jgi:hypothetical protein
MNRSLKTFLVMLFMIAFSGWLLAQGNFSTSIHKTRVGKGYWYNANTPAPSPGFETLTNVPISQLGCSECHPADNLNANGDPYPIPYPGMDCVDCHATNITGMPVTESDCYGCHGRQGAEINLGYSDVHRDATNPLLCWDCHEKEELHGDDGVSYNSMLEPGAILADCENCHTTLPAGHNAYDPHNGALHCDACHAQTVISCYNCHFESQLVGKKRAKQQIHNFVILANRDKDGKVGTMSFQSLTYQGNSWVAFAPFHSHSITSLGRACGDCHVNLGGQNAAILEYNATGEMKFATWDDVNKTLSYLQGVVPMPADYQSSFKMDFITYDGDPNDPVGPSTNWSYIGEDTWDGHQMLFATPLTAAQHTKLGMNPPTGIEPGPGGEVVDGYALAQNYPNPFNPSTTIEFNLAKATTVTLKVYNIVGEEMQTLLFNEKMNAGTQQIKFDAGNLTSGMYLYRLITPEFSAAKKMILMK